MPVDYSKWDALELSDDSDIEVHPNVDKRSFIRAKQHQIHEQRHQRKREIETLKYERIINDGLLERINALLDALQKHQDEANSKNPDELVFQALIESAGDPAKDEPPKPPEGVYTQQKDIIKYSKMMGSLIDQVKKEVDEKGSSDSYQNYVEGVRSHLTKVQNLQQELLVKLAQLEKEEQAKITSESIHDGFNVSSIAREQAPKPKAATKAGAEKKKAGVELLNPKGSLSATSRIDTDALDGAISSGAEADVEDDALLENPDQEDDEDEEQTTKLSPNGKQFCQIKMGDYRACMQFITEHPDVVNDKTHDGILLEAFNAQMRGEDAYAKQCVHQARLLYTCLQIGRNGFNVFLKRISTPGHQAQQAFAKDVDDYYNHVKTRSIELSKEQSASESAGVEQIQLHAVEPGTEIHITIPPETSDDPAEQEARQIFDRFSPGLQNALQSGSLDKVNEVLGKMSVEEAEEVVELLGQGGMLSLQQGVIDATSEEGQQRLKEIEAEEQRRKAEGEPGEAISNIVDEVD